MKVAKEEVLENTRGFLDDKKKETVAFFAKQKAKLMEVMKDTRNWREDYAP